MFVLASLLLLLLSSHAFVFGLQAFLFLFLARLLKATPQQRVWFTSQHTLWEAFLPVWCQTVPTKAILSVCLITLIHAPRSGRDSVHAAVTQTQLVLLNVIIEELQLVPGEVEFVALYLLDILKRYQPTVVLVRSLTSTLLHCSTNLCAQCFNDVVACFLRSRSTTAALAAVETQLADTVASLAGYIAGEYPECVLVNVPAVFSRLVAMTTEQSSFTSTSALWDVFLRSVKRALCSMWDAADDEAALTRSPVVAKLLDELRLEAESAVHNNHDDAAAAPVLRPMAAVAHALALLVENPYAEGAAVPQGYTTGPMCVLRAWKNGALLSALLALLQGCIDSAHTLLAGGGGAAESNYDDLALVLSLLRDVAYSLEIQQWSALTNSELILCRSIIDTLLASSPLGEPVTGSAPQQQQQHHFVVTPLTTPMSSGLSTQQQHEQRGRLQRGRLLALVSEILSLYPPGLFEQQRAELFESLLRCDADCVCAAFRAGPCLVQHVSHHRGLDILRKCVAFVAENMDECSSLVRYLGFMFCAACATASDAPDASPPAMTLKHFRRVRGAPWFVEMPPDRCCCSEDTFLVPRCACAVTHDARLLVTVSAESQQHLPPDVVQAFLEQFEEQPTSALAPAAFEGYSRIVLHSCTSDVVFSHATWLLSLLEGTKEWPPSMTAGLALVDLFSALHAHETAAARSDADTPFEQHEQQLAASRSRVRTLFEMMRRMFGAKQCNQECMVALFGIVGRNTGGWLLSSVLGVLLSVVIEGIGSAAYGCADVLALLYHPAFDELKAIAQAHGAASVLELFKGSAFAIVDEVLPKLTLETIDDHPELELDTLIQMALPQLLPVLTYRVAAGVQPLSLLEFVAARRGCAVPELYGPMFARPGTGDDNTFVVDDTDDSRGGVSMLDDDDSRAAPAPRRAGPEATNALFWVTLAHFFVAMPRDRTCSVRAMAASPELQFLEKLFGEPLPALLQAHSLIDDLLAALLFRLPSASLQHSSPAQAVAPPAPPPDDAATLMSDHARPSQTSSSSSSSSSAFEDKAALVETVIRYARETPDATHDEVQQVLVGKFLPLMDAILQRFKSGAPDAREEALRALQLLLHLVGPRMSRPTVVAFLRLAMQTRRLQCLCCAVWRTFLENTPLDEMSSSELNSVVAYLLLGFPNCPRQVAAVLDYLLVENSALVRHNIRELPHIPESEYTVAIRRALHTVAAPEDTELSAADAAAAPADANVTETAAATTSSTATHGWRELVEQIVRQSLVGVNSTDVDVKNALVHMHQVLRAHARDIYAAVLAHEDEEDTTVSRALEALLKCARSPHEDIQLLAAECLGVLGAIDPSRVSCKLRVATTASATASSSAAASASSSSSPSSSLPEGYEMPPSGWSPSPASIVAEEDVDSFAIWLLEAYLVKALNRNTPHQDFSAYSIQEVLRALGCRAPGAAQTVTRRARQVRERVRGADTQRIITNYLASNYVCKQTPIPRCTPIFGTVETYRQWLQSWVKLLIQEIAQQQQQQQAQVQQAQDGANPLAPIFNACSAVILDDVSTAEFLLPYLVRDVLMWLPQLAGELVVTEVTAVLGSYRLVCNDSGSSMAAMAGQCAQLVFNLFDWMGVWIESERRRFAESLAPPGGRPGSSAASASAFASASASTTSGGSTRQKRALAASQQCGAILFAVPQLLLARAAHTFSAHARALRHFETYARQRAKEERDRLLQERQRRPRAPSRKDAKESEAASVSVVPVAPVPERRPASTFAALREAHASWLQAVFTALDDSDNLAAMTLPTGGGDQQCVSRRSDVETLEHRGLWFAALAEYDTRIARRPADARLRLGRVRCLREVGYLETLLTLLRSDVESLASAAPAPSAASSTTAAVAAAPASTSSSGGGGGATQNASSEAGTTPIVAELLSYGVEAAWRLGDWRALDETLAAAQRAPYGPYLAHDWEVSLGRVFAALAAPGGAHVARAVAEARRCVLPRLAAASCESYQRCYPDLIRLHLLEEVAQAAAAPAVDPAPLLWGPRLGICQQAYRVCEPILAVRHALCAVRHAPHGDRTRLLDARLARRDACFHAAFQALQLVRAESDDETLEEAKLKWAQGAELEAVALVRTLLERQQQAACPSVPTAAAAVGKGRDAEKAAAAGGAGAGAAGNVGSSTGGGNNNNRQLAKATLLLARWTEALGEPHVEIKKQYSLAIERDTSWEKSRFYMAKYFDSLVVRDQETSAPRADRDRDRDRSADLMWLPGSVDAATSEYVVWAMQNYARGLMRGTRYMFHALPRLLTLWFNFGTAVASEAVADEGRTRFARVNKMMSTLCDRLPAHMWLSVISQLKSHLCDRNRDLVRVLMKILSTVLVAHPQIVLWQIVGLLKSTVPPRRDAIDQLVRALPQDEERQRLLLQLSQISDYFMQLARHSTQDTRISLSRSNDLNLNRLGHMKRLDLVVPSSAVFATYVPAAAAGAQQLEDDMRAQQQAKQQQQQQQQRSSKGQARRAEAESTRVFPTIASIEDSVGVMKTKVQPKKIVIVDSFGESHPFLCKLDEDMRIDSRVMEIFALINKILKHSPDARRRRLGISTYCVLPLNEKYGLIEWVTGTCTIKSAIHRFEPSYEMPKALRERWKQVWPTGAGPRLEFFDSICDRCPVVLHRWFLENFVEPSAWYEARQNFTHSTAVMSMVGYVLGFVSSSLSCVHVVLCCHLLFVGDAHTGRLGDRHGENILLQSQSGSVMHVDFNYIFWVGERLHYPERVPYRLTRNVVDVMGITGVEGSFRAVCEIVLSLLRQNSFVLDTSHLHHHNVSFTTCTHTCTHTGTR